MRIRSSSLVRESPSDLCSIGYQPHLALQREFRDLASHMGSVLDRCAVVDAAPYAGVLHLLGDLREAFPTAHDAERRIDVVGGQLVTAEDVLQYRHRGAGPQAMCRGVF